MTDESKKIVGADLGDKWQQEIASALQDGQTIEVVDADHTIGRIIPVASESPSGTDHDTRHPELEGSVLGQLDLTQPTNDPWLYEEGKGLWGPPESTE